jgi:hypothetical protein
MWIIGKNWPWIGRLGMTWLRQPKPTKGCKGNGRRKPSQGANVNAGTVSPLLQYFVLAEFYGDQTVSYFSVSRAITTQTMAILSAFQNTTYHDKVAPFPAMTAYRRSRVIAPLITVTLDGGKWSNSRPGRCTPGRNPGTHWIWGWVGSRAGLDVWEKRRISCSCRDWNPRSPSPKPSCYAD